MERVVSTNPDFKTDGRGPVFLPMQVSNEIISRCCAAIKLPEVFSPNVTNVSAVLQQCIEAGGDWKALYQRTAAAVTAKSARPWDFSESPIFAHVDAFIQRCADLLEVCRTYLRFLFR